MEKIFSHPSQEGFRPLGADLRGWLDFLQLNKCLSVIKPGNELRFGVAGTANRLDGSSASFFSQPGGHKVPIVSGVLSSRLWIEQAMGVDPGQALEQFKNACNNPMAWRESAEPPCQEVIHHHVDLLKLLPIPVHNEHDSGPYITAGLLIAKNPQTGIQNVAIHRLQISGPNRLGALLLPRHTLAFFQSMEDQGKDLDIAIVIGADPLTLLASQAIVPINHDELEIASALHGQPLEVTPCVTNATRVPAHAEIVLEGRLLANIREDEGPFGEFPQYYGEKAKRHVIEIDAVTHRKKPIFHTIVGGSIEHLLLGAIPREATILNQMKKLFPSVLNVHLSRGGVCRYHLFVQVGSHFDGEAKNIILGAFASHYDIKHVVVVDSDVDIYDSTEVEWAIATRFQAHKDLVMIENSQGSKLDPSTANGIGSKLGFDATRPLDAQKFKFLRIRVPGEKDIDLEKQIDSHLVDWRKVL